MNVVLLFTVWSIVQSQTMQVGLHEKTVCSGWDQLFHSLTTQQCEGETVLHCRELVIYTALCSRIQIVCILMRYFVVVAGAASGTTHKYYTCEWILP